MAPRGDDRLPPPTGKETKAGFLPRRLFAFEVHCLCAIFGHGASRGSCYREAVAAAVVVVVWRRMEGCSFLLEEGKKIKVFANLAGSLAPEVV